MSSVLIIAIVSPITIYLHDNSLLITGILNRDDVTASIEAVKLYSDKGLDVEVMYIDRASRDSGYVELYDETPPHAQVQS